MVPINLKVINVYNVHIFRYVMVVALCNESKIYVKVIVKQIVLFIDILLFSY